MARSLADRLAHFSSSERKQILRGLGASTLDALRYHWPFWARPGQLPPPGDQWVHWGIVAGRGAGKTRSAGEFIKAEIAAERMKRIAFVGRTAKDVRDVMVEGESGILSLYPPNERPHYEPSKARITWRNGAIATLYTSKEPNLLRGPQHDGYWADEVASWLYPDETWDNLMFGLRLGQSPRGVFTTTPKPIKLVRSLMGKERAGDGTMQQYPGVVLAPRMSTYENIENLAPTFINTVVKKYQGTRLGRQELFGELLLDVPGALWTLELIDSLRWTDRVPLPQNLRRIVVAIDPAVTSDPEESNETGIICVGRDNQRTPHFYVFADDSGILPAYRGNPNEPSWARRAVNRYRDVGSWDNQVVKADRIVGEVNNGGDLVEAQLRIVDPNVSYRAVHASRGKRTRGEPVAALYEQGRVHHCGAFDHLEDQMITWVPDMADDSPDRTDALVWAVSDLAEFTSGPPRTQGTISRRTLR